MLVRAASGPRLVPPVGMAAVQHGSTATHLDAGGLVGMREDGDLHRWMRVDVLPPDDAPMFVKRCWGCRW
jgi:hypothetical protein